MSEPRAGPSLTEIAWLAGLWDGEGSVGIRIEQKADRPLRSVSLVAHAQMSHTHEATVHEVMRLLAALDARGAAYLYRERNPERHLPAWHIRVPRLLDLNILSRALLPYSVTKREQWMLMLEYTSSRLTGADIEESGRVRRGVSNNRRHFTEYDIQIAQRLRELNVRGPAAVERTKEWQSKIRGVLSSRSSTPDLSD